MISVIVPVLNEISNLDELILRTEKVLLPYKNFEIIFIDDGSTDGTRKKLINICKSSNSCRAIFFDRNYGHQMALLAGFKNSRGDIIITIDGDLSDPPEIIEDLLNINSQGYDVVNTVRIKRENEKLWRIIFIKLFYLLCDLFRLGIINDSGDFRLLNRKALNLLINTPYKKFFVRALVPSIDVKQFTLKYNRKPRNSGIPKGNFIWLCIFGIDCCIGLKIFPKFFSFTSDSYKIEKKI